MKIASLVAAAFVGLASFSASAQNMDSFPVGPWTSVSIVNDRTGAFAYCAVETNYDNGLSLAFARNPMDQVNIAVGFADERLSDSFEYAMVLRVDLGQERTALGFAPEPNVLVMPIGKDEAFYEALQNGKRLAMEGPTDAVMFSLQGTKRALDELRACVMRGVRDETLATPSFDDLIRMPETDTEVVVGVNEALPPPRPDELMEAASTPQIPVVTQRPAKTPVRVVAEREAEPNPIAEAPRIKDDATLEAARSTFMELTEIDSDPQEDTPSEVPVVEIEAPEAKISETDVMSEADGGDLPTPVEESAADAMDEDASQIVWAEDEWEEDARLIAVPSPVSAPTPTPALAPESAPAPEPVSVPEPGFEPEAAAGTLPPEDEAENVAVQASEEQTAPQLAVVIEPEPEMVSVLPETEVRLSPVPEITPLPDLPLVSEILAISGVETRLFAALDDANAVMDFAWKTGELYGGARTWRTEDSAATALSAEMERLGQHCPQQAVATLYPPENLFGLELNQGILACDSVDPGAVAVVTALAHPEDGEVRLIMFEGDVSKLAAAIKAQERIATAIHELATATE